MAEEKSPDSSPSSKPAPDPVDELVSSEHTVETAAGSLSYTVTAGRVVLREEEHKDGEFGGHTPKAELFVVSYVANDKNGEPDRDRPVVFAFNGGPGSSSIWLHLGLLGPRRVVMGDAGELLPPPWSLTDNAETVLAHADLVFIDPVSTGYSRVVKGGKPADFHGYQRDVEAVGEMIRLWTSRNQRWLSPKYLVGESYGTLRAAALAHHLQSRYGLYLNGLGLISTVLDIGTIDFAEGDVDLASSLFLPTYAAIASYHGKAGDRPLREVVADAETLAADAYPRVLAAGHRLAEADRQAMATELSALTGLEPDWLLAADLRIDPFRFFAQLLRDRGLTVGRLDGRFTGWDPDAVGEKSVDDPSYHAIHGPYAATFNHYVRHELSYESDLPYEVLTDRVSPWSYKEFEGRHVSVAGDLAAAMRTNPALRLQIACGYYDAATPHFAAEYSVAHLPVPLPVRGNIELNYYEAGHMMYVHEPSRVALSADLARFVTFTR